AGLLIALHDGRQVRHVGAVDGADIRRRRAEPWVVGLMRPKRRPGDEARRASTGDRRTSRIEKADQGRRVYRMPFPRVGARDPGPAPVDPRPAAVMERREPPGLVVDPGPAPRAEVAPVSLAIRHPRRSDLGIPDAAVVLSL